MNEVTYERGGKTITLRLVKKDESHPRMKYLIERVVDNNRELCAWFSSLEAVKTELAGDDPAAVAKLLAVDPSPVAVPAAPVAPPVTAPVTIDPAAEARAVAQRVAGYATRRSPAAASAVVVPSLPGVPAAELAQIKATARRIVAYANRGGAKTVGGHDPDQQSEDPKAAARRIAGYAKRRV